MKSTDFVNTQVLFQIPSKLIAGIDFVSVSNANLNTSYFLKQNGKIKYVLLEETQVYNSKKIFWINRELRAVGLVQSNSGYRFRNIGEQIEFMQSISLLGIKTAEIVWHNPRKTRILLHYYENTTVRDFIQSSISVDLIIETILKYISEICLANSKGYIMGNRWGPNTFRTDNGDLVSFDFKFEYQSPTAKEFELSQALYFCFVQLAANTHITDPKVIAEGILVAVHKITAFKVYNLQSLFNYMKLHVLYFLKHKSKVDGGPQPWILSLIH